MSTEDIARNIQKLMDEGRIWLDGPQTTVDVLRLVRAGRVKLTTWPDWLRWSLPPTC